MFSIVSSEQAVDYLDTRGDVGRVIAKFSDCAEAEEYASEISDKYHYGVEIVDTDVWQIV